MSAAASVATIGAAFALSAAIAGTVLGTRSAGDAAALVAGFIALVVARSALLAGGEALAGQAARRLVGGTRRRV